MTNLYELNGITVKETTVSGVPSLLICGAGDYSPALTFDCGQSFRFSVRNGRAEGTAHGRHIALSRTKRGELLIEGADSAGFNSVWKHYLGLDIDWQSIERDVCSRSEVLSEAHSHAAGIRILRQDEWEAICSFVISQNNNIPKIKGTVAKMCDALGEAFTGADGIIYRAFPTPDAIIDAGESVLTRFGTGYRAPYIVNAAREVRNCGLIPRVYAARSTGEAADVLLSVRGIGPKVAACSLLFGFGKLDAYPVDVWMKHAHDRLFGGCPPKEGFGPYAGLAQQYLFYYERYILNK